MTTPPSRSVPGQWGPPGGWPPGGGYPPPAGSSRGNNHAGSGSSLLPSPPPPTAGGRRSGWLMLAVFIAAELTFVLVSVIVGLAIGVGEGDQEMVPRGGLVAAVVVPTALAALVAAGGAAVLGNGPRAQRVRRELELRLRWRDLATGLVIGAAGLPLTILAAYVWAQWVGPEQANSAVGQIFQGQQLGPALAVALFFVVWLVAPVCEEVLYRGALWRAFQHWRWNRWVVAGVTTVVFAFAHFELLRAPLLLVVTIPIALARVVTGNLLASIVAHQVNNFIPAIVLMLTVLGVISG